MKRSIGLSMAGPFLPGSRLPLQNRQSYIESMLYWANVSCTAVKTTRFCFAVLPRADH